MTVLLQTSEATVRMGSFAAVIAIMAVWEWTAPLRQPAQPAWQRWGNHMALLAIGIMVSRIVLPLGLTGFALAIERSGWGFFNWWVAPAWFAVPATLLLLDLAIYVQHRLMHGLPLLWRLHRVHHADTHIDVTTALRFHPLELLVSLLWKLLLITTLGAPAAAVLLFEIILNCAAIFNHANVALPCRMEHALRPLIVTPELHHIHHSIDSHETDSNFGFSLSLWDRLFGTHRASAKSGPDAIVLGLSEFRASTDGNLRSLLRQPFRPKQ